MKIEIWSDVICPFCYIGKRKFEQALHQFKDRDKIEIIWKSFQLDPEAKTRQDVSAIENLAEQKGISIEYSKSMHQRVTASAAEVGLEYNFDKAIVANTLNAHQLTHLAAKSGLQEKAEEALFKAYFTDGKNIDDINFLVETGTQIGLRPEEIREVLLSQAYKNDVLNDIEEARRIGVRGVPFFLFNGTHSISGAQATEVFKEAIEKMINNKGN